MDCSGKHRSYGRPISFVRSVNLDQWQEKELIYMDNGGNPKAAEFFRKQGLTKPYDYRSVVAQKYRTTLAKSVEGIISKMNDQIQINDKVICPAKDTFEDPQLIQEDPLEKHQPKIISSDSHKEEIVTAKTSKTTAKGKKLKAKKIENFDLDDLTIDDQNSFNSKSQNQKSTSLQSAPKKLAQPSQGFIAVSHQNAPNKQSESSELFDKFKGENVKSISSDSMFNKDNSEFHSQIS